MNQKILVFAGKKQSGKSSAAKFVAGYILTQMGRRGFSHCPTNFTIDDNGKLIVNTIYSNIVDEVEVSGEGVLDLDRKDYDFITWASNIMWPSVKLYAFADALKYVAVAIFGIDPQVIYGSNDDKNQPTHIKWKDMLKLMPAKTASVIKKGGKYEQKMTGREFLQYFGTNVCRVLDDECWTRTCINEILTDGSELAIIQDCRFANEVRKVKQIENADVKVIKLTREFGYDIHDSENGLEGLQTSYYDLVIDNEYLTIKEKNQTILDAMYQWGWLTGHIPLGQGA